MKRRTTLALLLIVAISVGLLLWISIQRKSDRASSPATSEVDRGSTPLSAPTPSPDARPASSPQPAEKLTPREQRREIINAWEDAREKEVEFWGKVLDQHDEPVVGVEVTATITTHQVPPPGFKPQPTTIYSATTDVNGLFYIKGRPGRGFTIETMAKNGYVLPPGLQKRRGNLFWYNYDHLDPKGFKPDRSDPVVFRMWRLEQSEKLISGEGFYGIVPDGSVYTVDLLTQKHMLGELPGDFRVRISRPPNVKWGARGYDWLWQIESIGGGLVETNDEFMYHAPEGGYQPSYEIRIQSGDTPWSDEVRRRYFLKSRGGTVYACLDVEVLANYRDKAVLSIKYYANPNGSRNLEHAPERTNVLPSRLKPVPDSHADVTPKP
jgi:hypothetical protein